MIKTFNQTFAVILTRSDNVLIFYQYTLKHNYCKCTNTLPSASNWESEDYPKLMSVVRGPLDEFELKSFISKL